MKTRNGSTWQLQEAKNRLSEVVRRCREKGPQTITVHGQPAAVLVPIETFRTIEKKRPNIAQAILNSPLRGSGIEIERIDTPIPPPIEF